MGWVTAAIVTMASAQAYAQIYVDGSLQTNGDGTSWSTAHNSLHSAIGPAQSSGLPIWVRAGTYRPHASDRNVSFTITAPVQIYGGFAGTETKFDERDVAANPTYLDGDLGNNDQPDFGNRGDNSYHVVRIDLDGTWDEEEFVILDGFIIRGGNADGGGTGPGSVPFGGGVLLENVDIVDEERRLVVQNAILGDSIAASGGGGVSAELTFIEIRDVEVVGNLVTGSTSSPIGGGGLYTGALRATRCVIVGNRAIKTSGGGAYFGSALSASLESSLVNVEVIGNRAGMSGGGLFIDSGSNHLTNCLLTKNHVEEEAEASFGFAPGVGGGAYVWEFATFTNCTVADNTAVNDDVFQAIIGVGAGIGVKTVASGAFVFENGVAWGNVVTTAQGPADHHPAQLMTVPSGTIAQSSLVYSNVQNYAGCLGPCTQPDPNDWFNIGADLAIHDPLFNDPSSNDYRHRSGAMAAAGESLLVPDDENDLDDNGITNEALPLDLTLGPRFLGDAVDMGAYEWCIGDLDLDGQVDGADLGALLNQWGLSGLGDLDGDGMVDGADLGILLNNWGPCSTENESGGSMLLSGGGAFEVLYGDYVDALLETWGFETWSEFLAWLETLEGWEVALILEDLI